MKETYLHRFEDHITELNDLLKSIDSKSLQLQKEDEDDTYYVNWENSNYELGVRVDDLPEFLIPYHFDNQIIERFYKIEIVVGETILNDGLFWCHLIENYEKLIEDHIEIYTDDLQYVRFKEGFNPKDLGELHFNFALYLTAANLKFNEGRRAKQMLMIAKQIDKDALEKSKRYPIITDALIDEILEQEVPSFDGLLEAIDNCSFETKAIEREGDIYYRLTWNSGKTYISFGNIIQYLISHHFDEKILDRCEIIREYWQNTVGEKEFKSSLFTYHLESDYYFLNDYLELDPNEFSGYNIKRFKPSINPKTLPIIYAEYLVYLATCEIKYTSSYNKTYSANEHLKYAKQINTKPVNQLKKFGTVDIDKSLLEFKSPEVSCKANDVFATINIAIKKDTEENYRLAITFINNLLKTGLFPASYHLKFKGEIKAFLPIKALPKKQPNNFFTNAVLHASLHPLIAEYIQLACKEFAWYENVPDENPAMPGTFAAFGLALQDEKYLKLFQDYLNNVDFEHQYLQENIVPVLVEKYGLNKTTSDIVIFCLTNSDNFKASKTLTNHYSTTNGIQLLKEQNLEESDKQLVFEYLFKKKIPKALI